MSMALRWALDSHRQILSVCSPNNGLVLYVQLSITLEKILKKNSTFIAFSTAFRFFLHAIRTLVLGVRVCGTVSRNCTSPFPLLAVAM